MEMCALLKDSRLRKLKEIGKLLLKMEYMPQH